MANLGRMRHDPVDAVKHPIVQVARELSTRSGRHRQGRLLVEGTRLVTQVLEAGDGVDAVLVPAGHLDDDLGALADRAGVDVYPVRAGVLRHVLGAAGVPDCLAVAPFQPEVGATAPEASLTVVCDRVADPGNLGSIVRTVCGLGDPAVVLTGDEDLTSRRAVDASRGAVLRCRVHRFRGSVAAVAALRQAGFLVVAAVGGPGGPGRPGVGFDQVGAAGRRVALVVGNETDGIDPAVVRAADTVATIPLAASVESLNVAVAAGIGLYALRAAGAGRDVGSPAGT